MKHFLVFYQYKIPNGYGSGFRFMVDEVFPTQEAVDKLVKSSNPTVQISTIILTNVMRITKEERERWFEIESSQQAEGVTLNVYTV